MSEHLDEGKVFRGCFVDTPRQYLADLESSSLEADDWLRPRRRRKNTHVTGTGRFLWPHRYPGGGKRHTVCIPPVLDQDRAWCFLTEQSRFNGSEYRRFARVHGQDDGITMRR
jgi:hypothetical protein